MDAVDVADRTPDTGYEVAMDAVNVDNRTPDTGYEVAMDAINVADSLEARHHETCNLKLEACCGQWAVRDSQMTG